MTFLKFCQTVQTLCIVAITAVGLMLFWQLWPKPAPVTAVEWMSRAEFDAKRKEAGRAHDGRGVCIYDGIREKVAPGSKGRELTPEEEGRFIEALEEIGADTTFVKRKR